ncbi:TspO/MBR family protein [Methylophaga sp.]|uniref:TspO/MBR family protein n=1 Tax=Methylophaga sp. TaxID=2024840 RepID=UPI003F6A4DBC
MSPLSKKQQVSGLIAWMLVVFTASAVGAIASIQAKSFYGQLIQPDWAPPPAVFGPVWTTLFAMMGLAAWFVWRSGGLRQHTTAFVLFISQLAINALWSWLFFAWHLGFFALIDVLILWLLIAATMIAFWRVRPLAGALFIPYLIWVSFAAGLNYVLWQLNPQILG